MLISFNLQANILEMVRASHDYKVMTPQSLEQTFVEKPYGLWIELLEFYGKRNYCLHYKTPFKNNLGELKLLLKKGGVCQKDNVMWYQGEVEKLQLKIKKSEIDLSYEVKVKKHTHKIKLINMLLDEPFKLLDPAVKKKILPGLHLVE